MSDSTPAVVGAAGILQTIPVTTDPNRELKLEVCRNAHGSFLRLVEKRREKTNWVCFNARDLPNLLKALTDLPTA